MMHKYGWRLVDMEMVFELDLLFLSVGAKHTSANMLLLAIGILELSSGSLMIL